MSAKVDRRPTRPGAGARTRQPENSKRAHFTAPALQTPPKIPRKDPKREKEERKLWRRREKKARNFGPPTLRGSTLLGPTLLGSTLRGPTLRGPTFSRFGPPPFGAHPSRAPHFVVPKFNTQNWPTSNRPKSKLAEVEIGRSRNWPKSKLAEVDHPRCRLLGGLHLAILVECSLHLFSSICCRILLVTLVHELPNSSLRQAFVLQRRGSYSACQASASRSSRVRTVLASNDLTTTVAASENIDGFQQRAAASGSPQQASSSVVHPWLSADMWGTRKLVRGNESISSVEGTLSRGKRNRDLESAQTLSERRNLHVYLEQKADLAVQGQRAPQKILSEAEAEMDIINWGKRNSDIAHCETNREFESQSLELNQAHQRADQAQRERISLC